jgi:hypothetical protein
VPPGMKLFSVAIAALVAAGCSACGGSEGNAGASSSPNRTARVSPIEPPPRCASRLSLEPANRNQESDKILVPPHPRVALLCRYFGLGFSSPTPAKLVGKLANERLLWSSGPARGLARAFDRLRLFPKGTRACPADDESAIYVLFLYDGQPSVPVRVDLSGCGGVSNGRTPRAFIQNAALERRLRKLVPPPASVRPPRIGESSP